MVLAVVVSLAGCGGGASNGGYPSPIEAGRPANVDASVADTLPADALVEPTDINALGILLREGRLSGWIHGAVHDRGLYVFTYRKPGDFFSFADFPLTPATADISARLLQIKRHDAVTIKGDFIQNAAPIHHIRLQALSVNTTFVADEVAPPRTADTAIPEDLAGQTDVIAKVHAVHDDGRILVVEYGDAVIPVFVAIPALTAGLYRNDKIRLAFEFAIFPPRPTHMWLDTAAARPLEVLERLVDLHGKPFEADGTLVRFPQSPQISTDVYALEVVDADAVTREYTLLNQDPSLFAAIHDKLSAAWMSRPGMGIDGRNKLINPAIRVHARGTFNLVAPNQANAQILLDSADDVTITFAP